MIASILINSKNIENLDEVLNSYEENAYDPNNFEIIININPDDINTKKYLYITNSIQNLKNENKIILKAIDNKKKKEMNFFYSDIIALSKFIKNDSFYKADDYLISIKKNNNPIIFSILVSIILLQLYQDHYIFFEQQLGSR